MPYTGTPRTWVAGEVPTAAHFNDNLRDLGRGFTDAWTSYTPTLTASTTNPTNWTQTGYYCQVGKLVHVKVRLVAGASMTVGSGTYRFALPTTAALTLGTEIAGAFWLYDSSSGNAWLASGNLFGTYANLICAAGGTGTTVTNALPWVWAASDTITGSFTYEAS
jgi:hypothetical protein